MNTSNESNTQTDLSRVLKKIAEIVEKSEDGDYIYRGEQECYEKVSSGLYRDYLYTEETYFDMVSAQETILEEAKTYIGKTGDIDETDDIGILTELQHFGGRTNLIDFTEDYLIALFFACDGSHEEEGRVILLKRESYDYAIRRPRRAINRVESQRSVFVESPTGFVEPDIEVTIPAELKMPMLKYLKKYHRISIETIYNDLHGFIRRSASGEFLKGLTCQSKLEDAETFEEKPDLCKDAIKHYTEALKLNPGYAAAYNNRGMAYAHKGEIDKAIQDYNTAIILNPHNAIVYNNRGVAYVAKGDFDKAIQDLSRAIDMNPEFANPYSHRGKAWLHLQEWENARVDLTTAKEKRHDIVASFQNFYESVADFEAQHDVKVPEDIAALLRGD